MRLAAARRGALLRGGGGGRAAAAAAASAAAAAAAAGGGGGGAGPGPDRPWLAGGALGGGGAGVALGKFDGLHRGHAALAREAAGVGSRGGGGGWLVSFSGMADALGWAPRLPLVAPPDRPRVLAGLGVRELVLPFAAVRGMDPREFLVGVLQRDLGVCGVCCGRNYRFGRGASGDADTLREICVEAGMEPRVLELLAAGEGRGRAGAGAGAEVGGGGAGATPPCSSTGVRECLAVGNVAEAGELLGRPHRLVLDVSGGARRSGPSPGAAAELAWDPEEAAKGGSGLLNQPPAPGVYSIIAHGAAGEPLGAGRLGLGEGQLSLELDGGPGAAGSRMLGLDLLARLD